MTAFCRPHYCTDEETSVSLEISSEILTDTMHENHITLVVKNLLWLPVKYRIMCKVLVINLQVLKLTWVWIPQRHSGTIHPQSFSLVSVNWISSFWLKTLSYRAFLVFARSSWNSLTMEVRLSDSLTCSKSELRCTFSDCLYWDR